MNTEQLKDLDVLVIGTIARPVENVNIPAKKESLGHQIN
jgi:hypothetical protein